VRWDGSSLLTLGHKNPVVLEVKKSEFWVRDFSIPLSEVKPLLKMKLNDTLKLSGHRTLTITPLRSIKAIDMDRVRAVGEVILPKVQKTELEDLLFQKHVKRFASAFALLLFGIIVSKFFEPEIKSDSELIPQKYAKLILSRPKNNSPSRGGSSPSQAQTKGIARAFQSKTVQKSMASILKGGLTKYSIMSTGKAVQALTQSMNTAKDVTGLASSR